MKGIKTLVALAALLPVIASAQSVNHRQYDQHRRIEQGIHSGSLTWREAARIRAREARIRSQERAMRFHHHGHLTPAEQRRLDRELGRTSRTIYHQKHDPQHRGW